MHLLIAENDNKILKSLKHIFESNKYTVTAVLSGTDVLTYAEHNEIDGIILDIMMPDISGVEILKKLRAHGISTPTLFLTEKAEVCQCVDGLDAGADDYVPKTFATAELLARVRAMLRRKENYTPDIIKYEGLILNRSTYELCYKNVKISLSGKEFSIIEMLFERPNFVVTVDAIISNIWGWENDIDVSTIWVHISNIRKKLLNINSPLEIHFVRGAGYKLEIKK